MIIQRHDIAATCAGVTLDVQDGKVTLDEWSPYGQATLVCALPSAEDVDLIDPREDVRVHITLTRDVGAQSRSFDLVLTDRTVDHDAATLTLTAATDEAVLQGLAHIANTTNYDALGHQWSLRQVINQVVLSQIGASLEPGAADANVIIDADATNLIPNPSNQYTASLAGYTGVNCSITDDWSWAAHGTRSILLQSPSAADSYVSIGGDVGGMRLGMQAGKTYVFSGTGRVKSLMSGTAHAFARTLVLIYRTPAGYVYNWCPTPVPNTVGVSARLSLTVTLPADTTEAFVRAYHGHTAGLMLWDAFRLSEKTGPSWADDEYFDGSTADSSLFDYAWSGTANNSVSVRTGLLGRSPEMLNWEPGEYAWDFVAPLVQASGLRLYCDEQRRWRLVDPAALQPGMLNLTEAVNLTDGRDTISRTKDWFDAVVIEYAWTDPDGTRRKGYDTAAVADPKHAVTVRYERPYPGPGAAAAVLDRAAGRGRVLDLAALSDYSAAPGMAIQATLPDTPIQTGVVSAVAWSVPGDEMTVKSRGLIDTPATAWAFLAAGEAWTASPVGASWVSETI